MEEKNPLKGGKNDVFIKEKAEDFEEEEHFVPTKDKDLIRALERAPKKITILFEISNLDYEIPEQYLDVPNGSVATVFLETSPQGAKDIQEKLGELIRGVKRGWRPGKKNYDMRLVELEKAIYTYVEAINVLRHDMVKDVVASTKRLVGFFENLATKATHVQIIPLFEKEVLFKAMKNLDMYQKQGTEQTVIERIAYDLQKDFEKYRYTYIYFIITPMTQILPQILQQFLGRNGWSFDIFNPLQQKKGGMGDMASMLAKLLGGGGGGQQGQ